MDDDLIMELERDQAKREYLAMRAQQDRLHAITCPDSVKQQAKEITDQLMPQKI